MDAKEEFYMPSYEAGKGYQNLSNGSLRNAAVYGNGCEKKRGVA